MDYIDIINAIFEVFGGIFAILNCIQLYKDKQVKGISIISAIFFTTWSMWVIYFYYKTENLYSMYASILIGLSEIMWLAMWVYYYRAVAKVNKN
jgi:uncharacterized membrane protein YfcA